MLVAHRGGAGHCPENTLAAIEFALRLGVEAIEVDLRLSADGQLVLIHDPDLVRTTNGHGPVSGLAARELAQLDAGSHFSPRFAGEGVPTLHQALAAVGDRAQLDLDAKDPSVLEPLARLIAEGRLNDRCWVTGIDLEGARDLASLGLRTLPIFFAGPDRSQSAVVSRNSLAATAATAARIGASGLNIDQQLIGSSQTAAVLDEFGLDLWAFTVNQSARFGELARFGARAICSDFPGQMPVPRKHGHTD